MRLKLSQLKILIENFINELPETSRDDSGAEGRAASDPVPPPREKEPQKQNKDDKKGAFKKEKVIDLKITDEEIEDSIKSDADRDEDELKTIRGNKMIDKDLRDVLQSLKLLKKVSINKKTKRGTKIKINRQIDMIIRDIMGSVPKEKSKQEKEQDRKKYKDLNLDEAVNRFVRRLIRENVDMIDNKAAIEKLEDLNAFLLTLGDEELESNLKNTSGEIIKKVTDKVQRYVDRKEGDFFDENYEKKSPKKLIDELEKSDIGQEIRGAGLILYAASKDQIGKVAIELAKHYGFKKSDKEIIDRIVKFVDKNDIFSIKNLVEKLEEKESRGEDDEKVEWSVIERIKNPEVATGRKSDREDKEDTDIIEGHPNLSGLIRNYLKKDSRIKKILKSSVDQETRKDQVIRLLMNKFNDVQEFKEKINMMPLTDADFDEYDELNTKKTEDLTKKEKAKLAKLTRKIENKDKYERGKRIRNFIEVLVVKTKEGETFEQAEYEFGQEMLKQKESGLDQGSIPDVRATPNPVGSKEKTEEETKEEKTEEETKEEKTEEKTEEEKPDDTTEEGPKPNEADVKIFKKYIFSVDDNDSNFELRTFEDPGPYGVSPLKIPLTAIKGFKNPFTTLGRLNLKTHEKLSKSPWRQGLSGNRKFEDNLYILNAETPTGNRNEDINIYKKSNDVNLISKEGTHGGRYYDIAVDGILGNNHIIKGYIAVREAGGIYLVPYESQNDIKIIGRKKFNEYFQDKKSSIEIENGTK